MANIRDTQSGKMYAGHSPPTKERISRPSSKVSARSKDVKLMRLDLRNGTTLEKFWEMISQSHGGYLTLNTGECPKEENVSFLSQILEENPPEKYYLSQKACQGILRRASARGKRLPEVLRKALERQASE